MRSFWIFHRKLQDIFQRERQPGDTFFRALFRVPIKGVSILGAKLINNGILNKLFNYPRFTRFQDQQRHLLGNHFYVIVVPNTLHLLNPCLRLIPNKIQVVLILNGIQRWEEEYILKNYPTYPAFKLTTFRGSLLSHGTVLTLLLEKNEKNFGIFDHDLYVFDNKVFEQLDFEPDECVIGAFQIKNVEADLIFPTTHFMFFNAPLIRDVMDKYRINATVYRWIPSRIKPLLAEMNLGYHNYLKSYATVFDTFNMIQALAFYEGLSVKFVQHEVGMWHIGGASYIENNAYLKYIQLKFLKLSINRGLLPHFTNLLAQEDNIQNLMEKSYLQKKIDRKDVFAVELAVKKVGQYIEDTERYKFAG